MINLFPSSTSPIDKKQSRLFFFAALFLFLFSLILTLAPAVRQHDWQVSYRWRHWTGFITWLVGFSLLHREISKHIPNRDPYLLPVAALLTGWGLLTIYRLAPTFGFRQTIWLAIGLLLTWQGIKHPEVLQLLKRYKYISLISGLLLTGFTFLFGTYPSGNGPNLWLGFWGVYIQPSEPLKLLLIAFLSAYLADQISMSLSLAHLLTPTIVLIGAALALLTAQRDLGAAILFIALYFVIVFLASEKKRILVIALVLILIAGVLGYQLFDVIRIRVEGWINPWLNPSDESYQIVQSLIAIASGGILGRGPGIGNPGVVPVSISDFIFSAITEETGLLGAVAILILFGLLSLRGFNIALSAKNRYHRLMAAGLALYFAVQSLFIIGGNTRFLPLTGVTLPFVSYGGSSLLTSYTALTLLFLISGDTDDDQPHTLNAKPYLFISGVLLTGLAVIALITGWWTIVRQQILILRTDNPRLSISSRYVKRGSLLDRNNKPIAESSGKSGEFERVYSLPASGSITGYSDPIYGQSGLEQSLDDYLRGLRAIPNSTIWSNYLIYGQLPPGLDVRLSLDLELQNRAEDLLAGHTGGLVLLNAENGEILAMSSMPNFDANLLAEDWETLIINEEAPLLNRTTQGKYPLGAALGPFLLSRSSENFLPDIPDQTLLIFKDQEWDCALEQPEEPTWGTLISGGCPGALTVLGQQFSPEAFKALYEEINFDSAPDIPLQTAAADPIPEIEDTELAMIGQSEITVSPLQMALASASLITNKIIAAPRIALAVNTPEQGWVILAAEEAEVLPARYNKTGVENLSDLDLPVWHSVSTAWTNEEQITWFIGGTLPDWQGTPLSLALVLEENDPEAALQIGTQLLEETIQPQSE